MQLVAFTMLAEEAALVYTPARCRQCWLGSASDALYLSGSEAATHFEISLHHLLDVCADLPTMARDVLREQPAASLAIRTVPAATVLTTCISAEELRDGGVRLNDLLESRMYEPHELLRLGYRTY